MRTNPPYQMGNYKPPSNRMALCLWAGVILVIVCLMVMALLATVRAAELDLGMSYHDGIDTKKALDVAFKSTSNGLSVATRFRYADQNDEISENRGQLHLGYDTKFARNWYLWAFDRLGYDRKREIYSENFIGLGPKYCFIHTDKYRLSLSGGALQHNITYTNNKADELIRLSIRPKVAWQIINGLTFQLVAFYQPDLANFNDYIITGETSLKYSLSKKLGLKVKVEDTYRSVSTVPEKNDLTTVLALSLSF